jgi:hypothetical protein
MEKYNALLVHRKHVPKQRHNAQGRKLRSFLTSVISSPYFYRIS